MNEQLKKLIKLRAEARLANPLLYHSTKFRPSQHDFFYDPHTIILAKGGRRAGKTLCACRRASMAMTQIEPIELPGSLSALPFKPPVAVRVWCTNVVKTGADIIIPFFTGCIPRSMLDLRCGRNGFNKAAGKLSLKNGSYAQLMSYDAWEASKGTGESFSVAINIMDEIPPEDLYDSQKMRLLTTGGVMWISGTTDADAVSWDISWVEDRIEKKGDGDIVNHHVFSTMENVEATANEQDDPEERERRKASARGLIASLSDEKRKTMVEGVGSWRRHTVYSIFDLKTHGYSHEGATPESFVKIAQAGYGVIAAGMDAGQGNPTALVYAFISKADLPNERIARGDYIIIGEYWRPNAHIVQHLPAIQILHKQFQPMRIYADPHMWDQNKPVKGITDALFYQRPETLKGFLAATSSPVQVHDMTPVGPLWKGNNNLSPGIQMIASMLSVRPEPTPWPRIRVLVYNGQCATLRLVKSMGSWARLPESVAGKERYSKNGKDACDALRYLVMGQIELQTTLPDVRMSSVPVDSITGVPMESVL